MSRIDQQIVDVKPAPSQARNFYSLLICLALIEVFCANAATPGASTTLTPSNTIVHSPAGVTQAPWSLPTNAAWTLWKSGVPAGNKPLLQIGPDGQTMYVTAWMSAPTMATIEVYKGNAKDASAAFVALPAYNKIVTTQTKTVMGMAVNAGNEVIIGLNGTDSSTNPNKVNNGSNWPVQPMMARFDNASQTWIPATLKNGHWVYWTMVQIIRGWDNTMWAIGGYECLVYRSDDGGRSWTTCDVTASVKAKHPGYLRINGSAGAPFAIIDAPSNSAHSAGIEYIITEVGGLLYTDDRGASWHPVDTDWSNANSPTRMAQTCGNGALLAVLPNGKVTMCGTPVTTDPLSRIVGQYDPNTMTCGYCTGFSKNLGGFNPHGFSLSYVSPNGQMFMFSGEPVDAATGNPVSEGGLYTSRDGRQWFQFNAGLTADKRNLGGTWTSGLGFKYSTGVIGFSGNTAYIASSWGNIYTYTVP